jgi:hypothetical protein
MFHTGEWSEWVMVKETVKFGGWEELGTVDREMLRW